MIYDDIEAERGKQIKKGWTAEHDDGHEDGALAIAAGCLAIYSATGIMPKHMFPWDNETEVGLCDKERRPQLIISAALLVAEIERLDREAGLLTAGNGTER